MVSVTASGRVLAPYPMDNDNPAATTQHRCLAAMHDPFTRRRIRARVPDLIGARCLEVGAGAGSIATWLAEQVGPTGHVLATDLKPHRIPDHPRLDVIAHDLTAEPVPDGPWDLIHARMVLSHLPERYEILHRLVGALAPDGVILIEDWAALSEGVVVAAPSPEAAELYARYQATIGNKVFAVAGTDRGWARRMHGALLNEGLAAVDTAVYGSYWTGGSPGCQFAASMLDHLGTELIDAGMTERELAELRPVLYDPALVIHGHPLYSTAGLLPAGRPVLAVG